MTEQLVRVSESDAMPRCCAQHRDWATLSEHLLLEFPSVSICDVVREVRAAKIAATSVNLSDHDALEIGELIARQQLMFLSGSRPDVARLDPERHARNAPVGSAAVST